MYTLGDLADRLGLSVSGDAQRIITGLASLAQAGPSDLSFYRDKQYREALGATRAGAVVLAPDAIGLCPTDCLVSDDPYLGFARASALFDDRGIPPAGVHATAVVADSAQLHSSAAVGPRAVIEEGVHIGADVFVAAGSFIGRGARIGAGTVIHPSVVIYHGVEIGKHCTIHSQAVLGGDGFGFARGPGGWEKIHQLGSLRIGDRVDIGAGTTIDRGTMDDTVIEDGVIVDNQVQIAHNCRIGRNTAIAACCGLAGGAVLGANCTLAGGVGVVGHVTLCDAVHVTGMSMVTRSISEPGSYSSGTRMAPTHEWRRSAVRFSQLESIQRRLGELEAEMSRVKGVKNEGD